MGRNSRGAQALNQQLQEDEVQADIPTGTSELAQELMAEAGKNQTPIPGADGAGSGGGALEQEDEDEPLGENGEPGLAAFVKPGPLGALGLKPGPSGGGDVLAGVTGPVGTTGDPGIHGDQGPAGPLSETGTGMTRPMPHEIEAWKAFGRAFGLLDEFDRSTFATAPQGASGGVTGTPGDKAVSTQITHEGLRVKPGAPPAPVRGEHGDKDKDYFVWCCRHCELTEVIRKYAGRRIAGQNITETIIRQVAESSDA